MESLADEYDYPPLKQWSQQLLTQAGLFDIEAMTSTLREWSLELEHIEHS